jgi:putative transposase
MPRGSRRGSKTGIYHCITRGINKKQIFHRPADFEAYFGLIREYKRDLSIEIYHYCLMSNHTHFLIKSPSIENLGRFVHFIQRRYAYYYCKTYHWTGQVFQSRYKSIPVESEQYLLECGRYIERNPVRACLVESVDKYPHHSYSYYAEMKGSDLLTTSPAYLALSDEPGIRREEYKKYVNSARLHESLVDKILV